MKEDNPTETEKRYGSAPHIKNIINLLNQNAYHHRMHDVFRDFVAIYAITLSNAVDKVHFKEREAQYMNIIQAYSKEELERFAAALPELVLAYEHGFDDVLGSIYMQLELGNARTGQFFTPYHVCRFMAKIVGPTKEDIEGKVYKKGFVEANDCCVGAGAMIIALAEEMYHAKINYQQCLHVGATDVDITAVHMCYIQFTMYHIPAVITWGDSLKLESWGHWYTPAHIWGQWDQKLKAAKTVERMLAFFKRSDIADSINEAIDIAQDATVTSEAPPPTNELDKPIKIGEQITLF